MIRLSRNSACSSHSEVPSVLALSLTIISTSTSCCVRTESTASGRNEMSL